MTSAMWGAAPHARRHRHVAVALAAAACFGAAPSSAGAQEAEGITTAKIPSALWAVQISRRVSPGVKAAHVRTWRKAGINAVVVDVRQLGQERAARTRQLVRRGGLAYVPIVASARNLSAAGKLRAACRAARRAAPAQTCAVAASSPLLARALASRAVADFVVVRVSKPSALLKLRGKPSRSRIVAIVELKPGRFSTAAWESAIDVARASAGVDLGVAPLGTKPLRTLYPYLKTLTRSLGTQVTREAKMTPPSGVRLVEATSSSITLAWDTAAGGAGPISYDVYRDGVRVATTRSLTAQVDGLYCGQNYRLGIEAVHRSGSRSDRVELAAATGACGGGGGGGGSGGGGGDSAPPTTPGSFARTGGTTSSIALSWSASTDDVGVVGYGVYQGGTLVGSTGGTTYTVTALACGTSYSLGVDAYDAAGNRSPRASLTTSTSSCPADTQVPTTPTNLAVASLTQTSVSVTWNASSDNVGVTGYGRYRNGSLVSSGSGTSYTFSGLTCGTSYTLGVDAYDAAGNRSARASVSGSTSACSGPPPSGCPTLGTPAPPGYCSGTVISVTPASFGSGVFGASGISVSPGDVVVFEDGTYTDTNGDSVVVQVNGGGTSSQYVTFVSRSRWGAKIDGLANTSRYGFNFGSGVRYVRVEGFEIFGFGSNFVGTVAAPSASGVFIKDGGGNSQIVGNNIHNISNFCNDTIRAQTGVFIQQSTVVVENNLFHGIGRFDPGENGCSYPSTFNKYKTSDTGVYLQSPGHSNVTIRNNLFSRHENGWGVYVYQGGASALKIVNNTFSQGNPYCGNTHVFTDADMVDFELRNNVAYGPSGSYFWAWDLETLTNVVASHNVARGGLLLSGADCSTGIPTLPAGLSEIANLFGTDPLLINPTAPLTGGFQLSSGSPARDAGMNLSALGVAVDFEGTARPQGGAYDAGAYEAAGAPPPSDTQGPTTPTNLARTGSTTTSISVSWTASTDNVGVSGYGRYRNGSLVSSGSGTSFTFSGLSCGTSYTLGLDAYDAAGNRSGVASISASTSACAPPPPSGCPVLLTPTPVPGYCTGRVISISPSSFGSGVFGSGSGEIAVSPGDVVVFEDGTYTDANNDGAVMRIKASGTSSAWVTFVSRTKWGAHMWGEDNDAAEGISLDGADYVRVEGFEVSDVGNVGSPRGSSSGIDLYNGGKHSHLVGNHIHHVGRVCANPDNTNGQVGIFVQTGKNGGSIIVENNLIHDIGRFFVGENGCGNTTVSLDHGMYLNGSAGGGGGAANVTIRNNIFHDTHHGWGVQWYPGSLDNIHVLNNTFAFCNENKSYTCIVLDATISNSSIKNNVFYNPQGGKTVEAAGFGGSITIANNLTTGSAMHDRSSTPSGMTLIANLLGTDPRLASPASFDFRLQILSPAIDLGENLSSVAVDHEGRSRPVGLSHDIGAYEYGG